MSTGRITTGAEKAAQMRDDEPVRVAIDPQSLAGQLAISESLLSELQGHVAGLPDDLKHHLREVPVDAIATTSRLADVDSASMSTMALHVLKLNRQLDAALDAIVDLRRRVDG